MLKAPAKVWAPPPPMGMPALTPETQVTFCALPSLGRFLGENLFFWGEIFWEICSDNGSELRL